jgi:serine protease Do
VTFACFPRLKQQLAETTRRAKKGKPMNCFSRLVLASATGCFAIASLAFAASGQPTGQYAVPVQDQAFLSHSTQGYLGIASGDVDNDRAHALKLKEAAGAEILNIDRDAPAAKAGLHVHDVILQMNGQPVAGEQQLRRMLRETPAGRTVTLLISRDGQQQTVTVQLADRTTIEQNAWTQHMVVPAPDDDDTIVLEGPSGHGLGGSSSFLGNFTLGSPSVGVELDALGSQLADYFGVKDGQGLLVKHVAENSPASRAGLKAGDVITQANGQKMATLGEWMKMLHANRGKQVQLTLVRNHKEETVTLEAGKSRGEIVMPNSFFVSPEISLPDNGELAWMDDEDEPQTLTLQVKPSLDLQELPKIDLQDLPKINLQDLPTITVQPSVDLQNLQKQLQEQQQNANRQMQLLQQKIQNMDDNPMIDEME